jgi:hypothetical protein
MHLGDAYVPVSGGGGGTYGLNAQGAPDRGRPGAGTACTVSVFGHAIRLGGEPPRSVPKESLLRYALLAYSNVEVRAQRTEEEQWRVNAGIAAVLARPNVTHWLRLQDVESATTVRLQQGRTLLTDGPFVDSKDFLGGFIVVEAEDLDDALVVAGDLQALQGGGAIEVRPVREEPLTGA